MKTCQNAYLCSECVAQKVFPNHTVDTSQLPCYCDHACIRLDDCCSDYKHFCAGKSLFLLILPWLSANEYSWLQVNKGGVFLLWLRCRKYAIVYIAVRIHVIFNYMNHNIRFLPSLLTYFVFCYFYMINITRVLLFDYMNINIRFFSEFLGRNIQTGI